MSPNPFPQSVSVRPTGASITEGEERPPRPNLATCVCGQVRRVCLLFNPCNVCCAGMFAKLCLFSTTCMDLLFVPEMWEACPALPSLTCCLLQKHPYRKLVRLYPHGLVVCPRNVERIYNLASSTCWPFQECGKGTLSGSGSTLHACFLLELLPASHTHLAKKVSNCVEQNHGSRFGTRNLHPITHFTAQSVPAASVIRFL